MKIAVLVKQVPDTWGVRQLDLETGRVDRNASDRVIDEVGERALEVALTIKDSTSDAEVVVITMGPSQSVDALRKALSMGADSGVHILSDALVGADMLCTAGALAAALRGQAFDLILAGNESTDGRGGIVPAMIAELLGMPALLELDSIDITPSQVSGMRGADHGTVSVHTPLPAVVSVSERTPEARFPSFKGIRTAKKKPVAVQIAEPAALASSVVLTTTSRAARSAGRIVTDDGSSAAASELVQYLADRRLI
ncbi:electron transfer flavoprotein subunit beta/FixA family protein [Frigoribacterium sp. UYMn621]|uniref:electron transfer flavoprotein subunit beta/FixA family protein n=1 Tax=Frigoribacterium sp. UYMn621 TaxID=3156343 RepID=UPI0033996D85